MAKIIIKYKDLTGNNVFDLLLFATKPDEIAELLGPENINKLDDYYVHNLLINATARDEMRSVLQKYGRIQ